MKQDIELGIISAVLRDGDMKLPVQKKIREQFFMTSAREVWKFMWDHYKEYKKVPDLDSIQRKFPEFQPIETNEPIEYFINELQIRQKYNMILKGIQEVGSHLEAFNVLDAEKALARLVSKINTEINVAKDINWNEDVEARKERLLHRMRSQGIDGISYGIEAMDYATGGMHRGELISVVGKPGTGKTYFELACIAIPALREQEDVLFISREMEEWKIEQRMDAIYFQIPTDKLKLGRMSEQEKEEYFAKLDNLKYDKIGRFIITADDEKGFGLAAIQAKIEQHLPNGGVVIVDGSYLLDDDEGGRSTWEKVTNITRGLKRLARRTNCVIVQSSQIGRGQKRGKYGDGDAISFSSSFEQDSDVVWEVWQTEEMKAVGKMGVHGLKIREGDKPTLILHWNFESMKDFGKLAVEALDGPPEENEETIIY